MIQQILNGHKGALEQSHDDKRADIRFKLPELGSVEGLREVIASRALHDASSLGTVALAMITVPPDDQVKTFAQKVRSHLFRATDAVYSLPEENCVALVMDDCKAEDAPALLNRISQAMGIELNYGVVVCPEEGSDPDVLMALAKKRLG